MYVVLFSDGGFEEKTQGGAGEGGGEGQEVKQRGRRLTDFTGSATVSTFYIQKNLHVL